ncbi:MAG: zinc-dependent alcohol dehydrogenase family protein [Acidobacteriota bacterium]|jgi:alcohol dehydrogenase|nr:zinc-dependent alcohol dehydrogenase family protein [Acidobacteriota bacterium]
MKAVWFAEFGGSLTVSQVDDPAVDANGVIIKLEASGICRSDWHGWMGHDPDIRVLPHVPGHELAGTVEEVGNQVTQWKRGDRVTVPFVCACGTCPECSTGNQQICDHQTQPGFTHWGSFAQYVAIHHADVNLVGLPEDMSFVTAASLGCRFATSYRAVVAQGGVKPGMWVVVHGCGGVGLSAIMIAASLDAQVIAVDVEAEVLKLAREVGAADVINAKDNDAVVDQVLALTGRGADVSIDALGSAITSTNSILSLRKRGRHVQVGLLAGDDHRPRLPMEYVISKELEIVGSHGLQAHRYEEMLGLISTGQLEPQRLIGNTVPLEAAPKVLPGMSNFGAVGITVIDRF